MGSAARALADAEDEAALGEDAVHAIVAQDGTVGIGGGYVFRPHVDYKYQTREESDGNDAGSGWMVAAGGDIPIRIAGTEFFPKARVYFGSIKDINGVDVSTLGMEFKGTIRLNF